MRAMESSGSSVMPIFGVPQGDHEEQMRAVTTPRLRGAETSKTPATTRRKRPISSLYTLDEWVNKTRGMGGEGRGGGEVILGRSGVPWWICREREIR